MVLELEIVVVVDDFFVALDVGLNGLLFFFLWPANLTTAIIIKGGRWYWGI